MRPRNKPSSTFIERTEDAILRERELSIKRAYGVGLIRGRKEMIEKAKEAFNKTCGWLAVYPWYNGVFEEFVKAMEE